ncbi:hypothetical protein ACFLWI_04570 [Chloroflexota bacterium]
MSERREETHAGLQKLFKPIKIGRLERNGEPVFINADTIVVAAGMKPERTLIEALAGNAVLLHSVGDCVEPQNIAQAIEAVFRAGNES